MQCISMELDASPIVTSSDLKSSKTGLLNRYAGASIVTFIGKHSTTPSQWEFEKAPNDQVYIKNHSGQYIGVDGEVEQGAPIICSSTKQAWVIKADNKDATKFR